MAQPKQVAHLARDDLKNLADHGESAYLHATRRRGYDRHPNVAVGHGTLNPVERVVSHDRIDHDRWYREDNRAGGANDEVSERSSVLFFAWRHNRPTTSAGLVPPGEHAPVVGARAKRREPIFGLGTGLLWRRYVCTLENCWPFTSCFSKRSRCTFFLDARF